MYSSILEQFETKQDFEELEEFWKKSSVFLENKDS
jgi:hypothetical protein